MGGAIGLGVIACAVADAAWLASPDNQLAPSGSMMACVYVAGLLASAGLFMAAVAAFRSTRFIGWAILVNALAVVAAIGALIRLTTLPYGH
jgi:hypothetical protein